jgi:hypothetical protein
VGAQEKKETSIEASYPLYAAVIVFLREDIKSTLVLSPEADHDHHGKSQAVCCDHRNDCRLAEALPGLAPSCQNAAAKRTLHQNIKGASNVTLTGAEPDTRLAKQPAHRQEARQRAKNSCSRAEHSHDHTTSTGSAWAPCGVRSCEGEFRRSEAILEFSESTWFCGLPQSISRR